MFYPLENLKFEIRSTKSEIISNFQNSNVQNSRADRLVLVIRAFESVRPRSEQVSDLFRI
ncbi:MAG: hypothetical protein A2Z25_20145 [Planctomycetes bacterium RBG_16_55_9]|nr:MAG: hypothetical protein A2Z25_20145 [Planctomycetes bacterium RBG_16_55_9]